MIPLAPGQTFIAEDTLITSITVWRVKEQEVNRSDMKLWIVEVDSTGRPMNNRVVLDGPVIRVMYGDGVHPTEIRFDLDPPAALPYRGKYAFLVQNLCEWFFDLMTVDGGTYGPGEMWRSETSNYHGCVLWGIFDHWYEYDVCCKIEFCDVPTPVRSRSWGRVKSIYR